MAELPKDRHEMVKMFYEFKNTAKCSSCHAEIEWWKTTTRKSIPMNPMPHDSSPAITHFTTCPNSVEHKAAAKAASAPVRQPLPVEREVNDLLRKHKARVVVLVSKDGGASISWSQGFDGDTLRGDLIAAGNFVRDCITRKGSNE